MKKIFNYSMLLITSMLLALTGCKKEELVFDHELPQFEIKSDAILLEVIVPSGTSADEVIYITGEFNGNQKYQLEKAAESDKKWGIYLYENDFAEGKSLKDGFYFVSEKNGEERNVKGETVNHTLDVTYGSRTNVWLDRWASYFKTDDDPGQIVPGEYEHLYIIGNVEGAGWKPAEQLEFTMVGTDIFRGEFTFVADGTNAVCYFAITTAMGANNDDWATVNAARWGNDNAELTEGNIVDLKLQDGSDQNVTIAPGTYTITVNMVTKQIVIGNGDWATGGGGNKGDKWPNFAHDGDAIYVCNQAGWEECALYAWGTDLPELFGGWPGVAPKETFEFQGYTWYFFECGASNAGLFYNFIANNNGGGKQVEPLCAYELGTDGVKYIIISEDLKATEVEDPTTVKKEDNPEPGPEPTGHDTIYVTVKDTITTHLYFVDGSTNMHYLYAWGTSELFGGWPGAKWNTWTSVSFLDKTFFHYEFDAEYGSEFNLIVNNKGYSELAEADQKQYDAFTLKVGGKTELFYTIKDNKMEEITPSAAEATAIRRLFRK